MAHLARSTIFAQNVHFNLYMKSTLIACLEAKLTPIVLSVVIITETIQKPYPRHSVHPESKAKIQQKIALIWTKEKHAHKPLLLGLKKLKRVGKNYYRLQHPSACNSEVQSQPTNPALSQSPALYKRKQHK